MNNLAVRAVEILCAARPEATLAVMQTILDDEIAHVAIGSRWFSFLCGSDIPAETYRRLVAPHFPKGLKPPFNDSGRQQAGLPADYYRPLADWRDNQ
jgi:uncharacterized ferritin-like protein (DUF455 family)